jgi:cytochrome b pre-mRNA-processing protein 3
MTLARALRRWLPQKPERAVYEAIVAAARHPRLYAGHDVPDTLDGRFEMIALHTILVLRTAAAAAPQSKQGFCQDLIDEFFRDMDRSLREMGTGDLSVGKKVRRMAEVFYGRLRAYGEALDADGEALAAALARNIWPGAAPPSGVASLAAYLRRADAGLRAQLPQRMLAGEVSFPEP